MKYHACVGPEKRSPAAFSRYRELVETYNRSPIILTDGIVTDAGPSWRDLPKREAEVFGIEPRLLNALAWAYLRYSNLIGVLDLEFAEFREVERAAYPEFFSGHRVYSMEEAIAFMATACRLPLTQAMVWVCRAQTQYVRSGLIDGCTTPPHWAFGRICEHRDKSRYAPREDDEWFLNP